MRNNINRMIRSVVVIPLKCYYVLKTALLTTDYRRWRANANKNKPSWDARNIRLAKHIPYGCTVIDLGAGAQTLRLRLKHGCRYQPCDIVKSSPDCLLCDFNRGLYPDTTEKFDYVVCSGILEYIRKPEIFLDTIFKYGDFVLLTYCPSLRKVCEKLARMQNGWVNHFTKSEIEQLFDANKICWQSIDKWTNHIIYLLWKSD